MQHTKFTIITFITITLWGGPLIAEYYRWIDQDGEVQYGDHVPAEETEHGRIRIGETGQVIEKIEPAKTPEELKRYEEEQRLSNIQRKSNVHNCYIVI